MRLLLGPLGGQHADDIARRRREHAHRIPGGRLQNAGKLGGRGLNEAEQLGAQFVERWQRRERLELIDIDDLAAETAAKNVKFLVLSGEFENRLGHGHGVLGVGDGGRP